MQCHDRVLAARIQQYLVAVGDGPVDVFTMATQLQSQYKEYSRRKRIAFATAVRLAYTAISTSSERRNERSEMNGKSPGKKRKRKRDRGSECDDDSVSIISSHSSNDDVSVESYHKGPNIMNSSLANLYRGGQNGKDDQAAAAESRSGFYIDTTPRTDIAKEKGGNATRSKKAGNVVRQSRSEAEKDITILETSTVTFADVGGSENELLELCRILVRMNNPQIYETLGAEAPRGFLLHGPPGCGKTLLAYAIAGELNMPFIKLAATELISGVSGDSELKIRQLFSQALAFAPCVLFLDEIDSIAPRRDTAQREMERRIVAQFVSCLDGVRTAGKRVILIGATSRPDALDPALRRAGRFDKEIALGIPNEKARAKILQVLCKRIRLEPNLDYHRLARLCPGYVGADLSALATEATASAIDRIFNAFSQNSGLARPQMAQTTGGSRLEDVKNEMAELMRWIKEGLPFGERELSELYVTMADFEAALKKISPSSKREGFATVPDVSWRDVGALANVREELKWAILYPIQHPEAFESLRLESKPQGILLCGPPGCGKTLLAKAVSNETAMNFISVKGPELLNMYVGESERAVREVFQRARNSAPCVIFFDELDSLCPERSSYDTGSSARVVNQLLSEMDGVESRRQVFIMGATNRPDMIDPAVLRPGRLDKIVYVGFPAVADRVDILRALTRDDKPKLDDDVDLAAVAADARAEWFTGADLAALIREACTGALKEHIRKEEMGLAVSTVITVSQRHFDMAFGRVMPSVQHKDRQRYLALEKKYGVPSRSTDGSDANVEVTEVISK